MADLVAFKGTEGEGALLAEMFEEEISPGEKDDKMGDEMDEEYPEDWTFEDGRGQGNVADAAGPGPDQGQVGGGLPITEEAMATPGIYASQSLSASVYEIMRDWEMSMELPAGDLHNAAGEANLETPGHAEESEANSQLRFRRCWAEPTRVARGVLDACRTVLILEAGQPVHVAAREGWVAEVFGFCVDVSKQNYYFDGQCDLVDIRIHEVVFVDGFLVPQETEPGLIYRVEHVVKATRIRTRLPAMAIPRWFQRRACLDLPDCNQMAADTERLNMICACEIEEDGTSYIGKVQWLVRTDNPSHYDDETVVPVWKSFPKYFNVVTEYQFVHYHFAKFLRPGESYFRGFTFWWELLKQGNRSPEWAQYEICFESMTQTRWKGPRADAPRHIRRTIIKA